jgi:hypothetical protein
MKPEANKQQAPTPVGSGDLLGGYVMRPTRVAVMPKGEPLFSEQCTIIEIEDEAGGEYLKVRQQSGCADSENQTIAINPEEWPALKNAVEFMLGEIAANPPNEKS